MFRSQLTMCIKLILFFYDKIDMHLVTNYVDSKGNVYGLFLWYSNFKILMVTYIKY